MTSRLPPALSRLLPGKFSPRRFSPAQLIALTFGAAILVGTLLLWLPVSLEAGQRITLLQALFMATSAVCVTGLAVVNPGTTFSGFGEGVLLLLIQFGGLGLVTVGTMTALLLRRRVGVRSRLNAAQQVNTPFLGDAPRLVRTVVLSALLIELVGAALLAPDFIAREGLGQGLYYALFHSVSAFNNAGFSLYATGLTGLVGDPLINVFIPLLIILGGTGFLVQVNVLEWLQDRRNKLTTNTRISLTMMAFLLLTAPLLFGAMEWNNPATLGGLPLGEKLMAAWFQGVTPRTAGFNTLDYSQMTFAALFYTMLLMLIGGNSGSTAGGIKTNTIFVMALSAVALILGRKNAVVFGRQLGTDTILRAMSVGLLSLILLALGILLLLVFNKPDGAGGLLFIQLVFEAVSAFATVGLSMNATPLLNPAQDIIIIALMFLGRIGPLTLAVAFMQRELPPPVRYPETNDVLIG